jgi:hypothetical protein
MSSKAKSWLLFVLPLALSRCSCPTRTIDVDGGGDSARPDSDTDGSPDGSGGDGSPDAARACPSTCPGPTSGAATGAGVCADDRCAIACSTKYPTLCDAAKACVDTTTDPKNCDTCGHDCLGGACSAGQCQPVELAQYTGGYGETISVGAQHVYVTTDNGYIGRAAKDGGDLKPVARPSFTAAAFHGTTVIEDGDRVFFVWVDPNIRLAYCLSASCDSTITPVGGLYTQYFAIDATDHRIAWIDYSPTQIWAALTTGAVGGAPITSSGLDTTSSGSPLFYAQGGLFMANDTVLERLPLSGGSFVGITTGNARLTILGANSSNIYLYDGTSVVFSPLPSGDGGNPHKLVDTQLSINMDGRFAVDETDAYWVSNGTIQSCQLSNCSVTQKTVPSPSGIQVGDVGVDAQAIYWVNYHDGTTPSGVAYFSVWKIAK